MVNILLYVYFSLSQEGKIVQLVYFIYVCFLRDILKFQKGSSFSSREISSRETALLRGTNDILINVS